MSRLKPCPFCGNEINTHIGYRGLRFFTCSNCGSITSFDKDFINANPKVAEAVWNRRVEVDNE